MTKPVAEMLDVRFGFPSLPNFLGPIDWTLNAGEFWALLGPNGAGKSTLLRILGGILKPISGLVRLSGDPMGELPGRRRAQHVAYLPQHSPRNLEVSVAELVLLGRYPHRSFGLFETPEDLRVAKAAMEVTQVTTLADRMIGSLSGGEFQRAHLAAAVAQDAPLLLLDEPLASLDLCHQLEILEILRRLAVNEGRAIVMVTHDVNLTAFFCTNVLLLKSGRTVARGVPAEVLTTENLEEVMGVRMRSIPPTPRDRAAWLFPDLRNPNP